MREQTQTGEARQIGRLPMDRIMRLDIVLPLRDREGLETFLKEIYDPASPTYRYFLAPSEFAEKFGPAQADYDTAVESGLDG